MVLAASTLPLMLSGVLAQEYELGPQDRVRITIVEWTLDELRSPISGEYTVSAGGDVALPLLGAIRAAGLPVSEFSALVSDRLQKRMELSERPNTSVEVVQFRPFYIAGEVSNPGEFAYRPGITVVQALSLAGGFPRPVASSIDARRELATERAAIAEAQAQLEALIAREARLRAELSGSETVAFAHEDSEEPDRVSQMNAAEKTIFDAHRAARALTAASESELAAMFETERQKLAEHSRALHEQLEPTLAQLALLRNLKDRGLAAPTRELDLQRVVSEVNSQLLEVETQSVRLQREFAAVQEANRRNDNAMTEALAREMRETMSQMEDLRQRADASREMIQLSEMQQRPTNAARYTILREDPEKPSGELLRIAAAEHTRLKPGDVLQVEIDRGLAPPVATPAQEPPPAVSEQRRPGSGAPTATADRS